MDRKADFERLDSFPYRHRLAEAMTPVVTASPDMPLVRACQDMQQSGSSAVIIVDDDGRATGIVTERDVLRHVAEGRAMDMALASIMSSPVMGSSADSFLYVGIARLARLGLRHLVLFDADGRPAGLVTARSLLRWRASRAMVLGDDVETATNPADLARVREGLPTLARGLLADGTPPHRIAEVVSAILRDLTRRAADLCRLSMINDGWGEPPAPFALLILGSGGRGESLLAFDQDNALVHTGPPESDTWFQEFAQRANLALAAAGIPECPGGVMARNAPWRRSLDDWKADIRRWVFSPEAGSVLSVDIFFDFVPVYGDHGLAATLKRYATETAAQAAFFVRFLAINLSRMAPPFNPLGGFVTTGGRIDIKKHGLLPLVSAARALAVEAAVDLTSTRERYIALARRFDDDDLAGLLDVHDFLLGLVLEQQLADRDAGITPSGRIDPSRLARRTKHRLKEAFRRIERMKSLIT